MKLRDIINESVTFSIKDNQSYNTAEDDLTQYDTVLSIAFLCGYIFDSEVKSDPFYYKFVKNKIDTRNGRMYFDSDGDDYDKPTGVVNFYVNNIVNDHFWDSFKNILNRMVGRLSKHVTVGKLKFEGDKTENGRLSITSPNDLKVVRIPIIQNNTIQDDSKQYEMNLANDNARNFLNLIGYNSEDLVGTILYKDIPKILMKLRNIQDKKILNNIRPENKSNNIIDVGLDYSRLKQYIANFIELLEYANKHKSNISYS